jgi:hypothetical protein
MQRPQSTTTMVLATIVNATPRFSRNSTNTESKYMRLTVEVMDRA